MPPETPKRPIETLRQMVETPRPVPTVLSLPHVPLHDARRMTGGDGQAHITLDGQVYTLRITRAGKLILTK
jgi:hemin uptake protein HemP